jgi:hypothetical protein
MAGFDAPIIEYADPDNGSTVQKRRSASEYLDERKLLIDFIRNFRRGREAYYRYVVVLLKSSASIIHVLCLTFEYSAI